MSADGECREAFEKWLLLDSAFGPGDLTRVGSTSCSGTVYLRGHVDGLFTAWQAAWGRAGAVGAGEIGKVCDEMAERYAQRQRLSYDEISSYTDDELLCEWGSRLREALRAGGEAG